MIGVDDHSGVLQAAFCVHLTQLAQVLIMVIGEGLAILIDPAAQYAVHQRIALAFHLPAAVAEDVAHLRRANGVQHDGQVAAGGVFHADRQIQTAGSQPVLLIFHRTRPDRYIGKHICQIAMIFRVQHFIRAGKARLGQRGHMQPTNGHQAAQHIRPAGGVALVQHSLVADARGAGLVGVDTGHDHNFVLHLFLQRAQPGNIIQHRIFPIGGTGADDQQQFVAFSRKNFTDFFIVFGFLTLGFLRYRVHLDNFLRPGQFPSEFHIHYVVFPSLFDCFTSVWFLVKIASALGRKAHHALHGLLVSLCQRVPQLGKVGDK